MTLWERLQAFPWVEHHCPNLLSLWAGAPHQSHTNENPTPDILEERELASGSFESSWLSVSHGGRKIIL